MGESFLWGIWEVLWEETVLFWLLLGFARQTPSLFPGWPQSLLLVMILRALRESIWLCLHTELWYPVPSPCTKWLPCRTQAELWCWMLPWFSAVPLPVVIQASRAPPQLLSSAASDSQWSHSLFALIPSWTKKVMFKRESDLSHLPVSNRWFASFSVCKGWSNSVKTECWEFTV